VLLDKLADPIPDDYVPPQNLSADVAKMVSDVRDAGLLRMTGGAAPNVATARSSCLLLGSSPRPSAKRNAHRCSR
jgi:hypothetical protein